ncbi:hypothetical protein [Alkalihalobacterium bogoriense]|uniref:hypothetical protein n=1 Tax=Alkalihalobacterium bogoriense TaxID=246272 RepID=UPI0012EB7EE3|nr:hypothetical protein [Alkalihalobacterium bogoriense]
MNFILYWRIFALLALVLLFATDVIELEIFLSAIAGIIVFYGIPTLIRIAKKK